jgi:DNA-binding NarL/FixJ family response regulator
MEVLKLAATGMSNKEIAGDLSLSVPTVKSHLVSTFSKMGVSSRTEAILDALRRGWVSLDEGDPESATV